MTCVRFKRWNPKTSEPFINIKNDDGCSSHVGYDGKTHITRLQSPKCLKQVGTIVHELLHTLGFYHEHTRSDRDQYVQVMWNNILPGHEINFFKLDDDASQLMELGLPYDYNSVLHYPLFAFSKGKDFPTLIPMKPHSGMIG